MNFDLTPKEQALQARVRAFAREVVAPGAGQRDETASSCFDLLQQMGKLGFLAIPLAGEWGGSGSTVQFALAVEEIGRVDAALGIGFAAHTALGCISLERLGTNDQKQAYLGPALAGTYLAAFALTEAQAGSDARNAKTTAIRDGEGWVISGEKRYITNAEHAGYVLATARTAAESGNLSVFLIPSDRPGLIVYPPRLKLGLRASETCDLSLSSVRVPWEHLLGEEGRALPQLLDALNGGRIGIAAIAVGIAEASLSAALEYAGRRHQFGRPISQFEAIQFKLADMAVEVEAARILTLKAAWLKDRQQPCVQAAATAKLYASETATRAANQALQIYGGAGYMHDYPIERYLRDAKGLEIGEGTSEIQRLTIARQMGMKKP